MKYLVVVIDVVITFSLSLLAHADTPVAPLLHKLGLGDVVDLIALSKQRLNVPIQGAYSLGPRDIENDYQKGHSQPTQLSQQRPYCLLLKWTHMDLGYRPAKDGIDSGLVLVFGHILPPPYQLTFDEEGGVFYLNGIDFCPGEEFYKRSMRFFNFSKALSWFKMSVVLTDNCG